MSSDESQELTEVVSTSPNQSPSAADIKRRDELSQASTSRGFPTDTVYLNVDPAVGGEADSLDKRIEGAESFQSALDPTNDMATSTSANIQRTEAAIVTEVNRSGPPPPYEEETYVYRDGRYVRIPATQASQNPRGDPRVLTAQIEQNRRPPPYSTFDPFLMSLFNDKRIRNQFVQIVYVILTLQLLFTFGCIGLCLFNLDVKRYVREHSLPILLAGTVLYFVLSMMLTCCDAPRRLFPLNFFLLTLFTVAMTMITATVSCFYDTYIVLAAFGITAGITATITALSFIPWVDITGMGVYLAIAGFVIFIYGLIACILTFFGYGILWTIYAWLVTILMCFYLMYDTQLIIGGKRVELSPQEYILGALILYTDIVMIFIFIMEILRCCR